MKMARLEGGGPPIELALDGTAATSIELNRLLGSGYQITETWDASASGGSGLVDLQAGAPVVTTRGTFDDTAELHDAIAAGAIVPGHQLTFLEEYSGYLLDGAPLNVWVDGFWYDTQREVLADMIAAGRAIPLYAPALDALPVVPLPEDYVDPTGAGSVGGLLQSIPWYGWLGAFWLGRRVLRR